jgi:hypothetical protein
MKRSLCLSAVLPASQLLPDDTALVKMLVDGMRK